MARVVLLKESMIIFKGVKCDFIEQITKISDYIYIN